MFERVVYMEMVRNLLELLHYTISAIEFALVAFSLISCPFQFSAIHTTLLCSLFHNLSCRSLFIMLDSLSYWDPCTSAVGRAWLNQVLQRHDIARVLEPLLLLLLHPKTHRVSIQRVQAQRHWTQVFPDPPEQEPSDPIYTREFGFSDSEYWP